MTVKVIPVGHCRNRYPDIQIGSHRSSCRNRQKLLRPTATANLTLTLRDAGDLVDVLMTTRIGSGSNVSADVHVLISELIDRLPTKLQQSTHPAPLAGYFWKTVGPNRRLVIRHRSVASERNQHSGGEARGSGGAL